MRPNLAKIALATALVLVVAACGGDDDDAAADTTAADTTEAMADETTAAPDTTAAETDSTTEGPGTVVDVAVAAGDFTTLVAAAEAAGLVETLSDPDATYTVFAPTDAAFATALDDLGLTAEELLADTDLLTTILTYHVLGTTVTSADIGAAGTEEIPVEPLSGEELVVVVGDSGNVTFRDQSATVTTADIEASNGVIHVIDAVLIPPSAG